MTRRDVMFLGAAAMALAACAADKGSNWNREMDVRPMDGASMESAELRDVDVRSLPAATRTRSGEWRRPELGPQWRWSGRALPSGDPSTSLLLIEQIAPVEVNSAGTYESTIRVTNLSRDVDLTDVVVDDRMPSTGYEFQSATPEAERNETALRWKLGNLAAGESKSIVIKGKVTGGDGRIDSCASATFTPLVCASTNIVSPKLELTACAPEQVLACEDIPLTFVVRNPGTGSARNVKVSQELPDGVTVDGRRTVALDVGTLRGGESREVAAIARAEKPGEFTAKATASAEGGLSAEATTKTAVKKPVLDIKVDGAAEETCLCRQTKFDVVVSNKGDGPARDLVLRQDFDGADNVVMGDGGVADKGSVTWRLGTLEPGASRTIQVDAARSAEGVLRTTASASAFCAEPVSASASTNYRGASGVLLEVVDACDPVPVGATTVYTIVVTNQGTAVDNDLNVSCKLEDGVEFVSANGVTECTSKGAEVKFAQLASLAPQRSAKWTITVRGVKAADTRFKTSLTTKETGERPIEETEATRVIK